VSKVTETLGTIGESLLADPLVIVILILFVAKVAGAF
jgi:hypothetical protein